MSIDLPFPLPSHYRGSLITVDGKETLRIIYYNEYLDFRCGQLLPYPVNPQDYYSVLEYMHSSIKQHETSIKFNDGNLGLRLRLWHNSRYTWSQQTFGPSSERGSTGPLKHLVKEVQEALDETDKAKRLIEYADCLHLIFDAANRDGFSLEDVLTACEEKLKINMSRKWPEKSGNQEPVEHEK